MARIQELTTAITGRPPSLGPPKHLTPVEQIPPELLSEIFIRCVPWPTPSGLWVDKATSSWIKVSHVCSFWRNVALGTPELWSFIDFNKIALVDEFLGRSKEIPISAQMHCDQSMNTLSIMPLLHQLPRISMLSLKLHNLGVLSPTQHTPAPYLSTLSMDLNRGATWSHPSNLSDFLQNVDMPALKHLQITNWVVHWKHPVFRRTLTTLILDMETRFAEDGALSLAWDQMLQTLSRLPQLKTLSLSNLPQVSSTPLGRAIDLPNLASLHLSKLDASCTLFLKKCSFPAVTRLSFETTSNEGPTLAPLFDTIVAKCYWEIGAPPIQSLSITDGQGSGGWVIGASTEGPLHLPTNIRESGDLLLHIAFKSLPLNSATPAFRFLSHIPLFGVESFLIGAVIPTSSMLEDWLALCEQMPNLTELTIQWTSLLLIPLVLYRDSGNRARWPNVRLPATRFSLPRLKTLVLIDVDMCRDRENLLLIFDALNMRRSKGTGLKKIRLTNPNNADPLESDGLAKLHESGCEVEIISEAA